MKSYPAIAVIPNNPVINSLEFLVSTVDDGRSERIDRTRREIR